MFKLLVLVIFFTNCSLMLANTKIYSGNFEQTLSYEDIYKKFENVDVLILGEEHNDKIGHEWKLNLIKNFFPKINFSISMEMFERDQQLILNEYLQGLIDEPMFEENMRLWNNYKTDYKPIVEFAKEHKIRIIASNAPRRYVRAVSRKGIEVWQSFSPLAETFLPTLSKVQEYRQKEYEEKFLLAMGMDVVHSQKMENFLLAQHIWDESMAECIAREIEQNKKKVIHINGRFHSDEYFGVSYRLKSKGYKLVTVSIIPKEGSNQDLKILKLADFIVFTKKEEKQDERK